MIYPGARVAVMGLGVTGRAAVRYSLSCGAEVLVSDSRPEQRLLAEEGDLLDATAIAWEAGGHSYDFLSRADLLLVSPGVDLHLPLLKRLRADGVPIVGELAIAAGQIGVPVVAVTGTNGKTTVTTLIGEICRSAGRKVFVGGNIGTPLYEYLLDPAGYDMVVVEVSSFQLESGGDFSPDVGLLLNITPDHLDRHLSMDRYVQAKMQLFLHAKTETVAVINGDDPLCRQLLSGPPARLPSTVHTFGQSVGCTARFTDTRIRLLVDNQQEEYCFDDLAGINDITLMNYAAAILAVRSLGCSQLQTETGLRAFRPLPHRIEFVAEVNGVEYVNDSKATNTGAVIGALAQFEKNVILLAGGRDKGDDYRLLRESVAARVKKMIVLGEAAGLLHDALADIVDIQPAQSMADAVQAAAREAMPGDIVLLSPACASFDMFTSYGHRGNEFKKAVLALPSALGEAKMGQAA
ncbi:UDP-N-acetylmuramoyl-L-alanine--D-glutamate ligase [Desulfocastanea catecholica]